jgi:hypothetical protein
MRDTRWQEITEAIENGRATILRDHHGRVFAAEAAVGGSVELRVRGTHKELAFDTHGGVTRVVCGGRTWQEVLLKIGVLVIEYETFVLVRGRGRPQLVQEVGETAGNYWVHFGSHQAPRCCPLLPATASRSRRLSPATAGATRSAWRPGVAGSRSSPPPPARAPRLMRSARCAWRVMRSVYTQRLSFI